MKHQHNFKLLCALVLLAAAAGSGCRCGCASGESGQSAARAGTPAARTSAAQAAMTSADALEELHQGNARFVAGHPLARDFPASVKATAPAQYPFAVVLSCLDSRQSAELIFDQGLGDIFSARVAGNILDANLLGSLEFACKISGAKLIVVVGHSNCGAVKGAIDNVALGSLTGLLVQIKPAIAEVPADVQPRNSGNPVFVQKVAEANVRLALQEIRRRSKILDEMIATKQIGLVGGMCDLETGVVTFFPE